MTANNSLTEALKPDLSEPEYFELELATKGIFTALFRFSNYTAATMAIQNAAGATAITEEMRMVKQLTEELESARTALTKPRNDTLGRINAAFKEPAATLAATMTALKQALSAWDAEQERIRQAALAAAREAARKEEERLQKLADKALAAGKEEKAQELQHRAMDVQPAPVAPVRSKSGSGLSDRKVWKFEILDRTLVPANYRTIDEKLIAAEVRSRKSETNIPGVRVWSEKDYSVRGA